jgi:hypothetical protein
VHLINLHRIPRVGDAIKNELSRAMAQGSYMNTYRTYKAGTRRLATWLVQAAKLCGVDSTSFATDKYEISLVKFIQLANTITESKDPKIKVPHEIVIIVRTVIALRKETGAI